LGPSRPSDASGSSRPWTTWFIRALAVSFLMQVAVNAVRPTVSYRALALGADAGDLGLIAAGFALLALVFAIPIGRGIDRRGEMPFVILGLLLVTLVSFALVGVDAIWALFVTQAVLGLGQILTTVGVQALLANSEPAHQDSRFGTFTVVVSSGQFIGPAAAGFVGEHVTLPPALTWGEGANAVGTSVFLIAGVAGVLGFLIALAARNDGSVPRAGRASSAPPEASMLRSVVQVLRQPNAPHAMFASISVLTASDLLVAYLPAYGEATGLSATTVGLLLSVRAGASMVSRIFMGPLTRRVGRGRLLTLSTAVPAIALAPLPLVDAPGLLFTSMAVAGLGLGLGQPLSLVWIAQTAPEHMRGTAVGVRLSGNRLGQVAIPALVGGIVGASGLAAVFVSMAMMLAGSSVLTASGTFPSEEP
jgi:MFS family permease